MVVVLVGRGLLRKELRWSLSDCSSLSCRRVFDGLLFFDLHYFWLQRLIGSLRGHDSCLQLEGVDLLHQIRVVVLFALMLVGVARSVVGWLLFVLDGGLSVIDLPSFGPLARDRLELREDGVAALGGHRKRGRVLEHRLLRTL